MKDMLKRSLFCLLLVGFFFLLSCETTEDFKVVRQVTGPIETNCYLIYGVKSKAAALVDPGWQIDSLLTIIKENELDLKYILITHGHIDHYFYAPEVKKRFPQAKMVMPKADYDDSFTALQWARDNYGQEWIDEARSDPDIRVYLDFDNQSLGEPDIYVADNQVFKLGSIKIKAIHCPGHSPGQVCYSTGNVLFSGDVLFHRSVGRTDTQHGSREDQIKSVRKLYASFPDSTIVYPGHRQATDIGSEKRENKYVTLDGGKWCTP
jgi:glyoxylase-like metal-dependent hydrolase (beta-lactamase superfamily II)